MNFDTAIKEGKIRMQAVQQKHIMSLSLTVSSYKFTFLRHSVLHSLIWPQSVKRTVVFPKTSRHLAVVTATGAEEQVVSAKVLP